MIDESRKAMDPRQILGKWAVKGHKGAYVTRDPKFGDLTHFSAEAKLYPTQEEAEGACAPGQTPEKVTGLRSQAAQGRDVSKNLHGGK